MSFAIITDSTSDISPARAQELGIYVIPLHVIIEGEDLLDQGGGVGVQPLVQVLLLLKYLTIYKKRMDYL